MFPLGNYVERSFQDTSRLTVPLEVSLDAHELSKRYGPRLLFDRLSFRLEPGESAAVTGPNGSGKSTLLRILAGVLTPSRGEVELSVNGTPLARQNHPLHTGLVAPYLNVYDGFSPRENLRFLARARSLERADQRIEDVLRYVAMIDRADDPVSTFSSGMKQRVKFAAALLSNPPLLLLDEPTVNLDAAGLEMVNRVAEDQLRRRAVLVVATNDAGEAERHARRIRIEDYS